MLNDRKDAYSKISSFTDRYIGTINKHINSEEPKYAMELTNSKGHVYTQLDFNLKQFKMAMESTTGDIFTYNGVECDKKYYTPAKLEEMEKSIIANFEANGGNDETKYIKEQIDYFQKEAQKAGGTISTAASQINYSNAENYSLENQKSVSDIENSSQYKALNKMSKK